jgi:DNA-binding XRE family transcriptional regulator
MAAMRRPRFEKNRPFYEAVGRRIAQVRGPRLKQDALAQKIEMTRTSIINIEKGRQQILLHTLVDIARALNVSPTDLMPGDDTVDFLLRDKPKKGRDWIKRSAADSELER